MKPAHHGQQAIDAEPVAAKGHVEPYGNKQRSSEILYGP